MLLDPVFLIRECRQHRGERAEVVFWLLAAVGLGGVIAAGTVFVALYDLGMDRRPINLAPFGYGVPFFIHCGACAAAAIYGGDLVIGREVRRNTLLLVQLAAYDPARRTAEKLVPALALLGVVWAAVIPIALCCAVLGMAPVSEIARGCGLAACAGISALSLTLLASADTRSPGLLATGRKVEYSRQELLSGVSVFVGIWLLLALVLTAWSNPDRWAFYGRRIPAWWVLLPVLLSLVLQAYTVTMEKLAGESISRRLAVVTGLVAAGGIYVAGLGAFWSTLSWWVKWPICVGVPTILALLYVVGNRLPTTPAAKTSPPKPRKTDRWAAAELTWITARWDNPVLLRDLRGSVGDGSIRRRLIKAFLSAAFRAGLLFFFLKRFFFGIGIAASNFSHPLFQGGSAAAEAWGKEESQGSLAMLLLTPLTSRELLAGRLAASIIHHAPDLVVSLVVLISLATWLAVTRDPMFGQFALALLPMLPGLWTAIACRAATPGLKRDQNGWWDPQALLEGGGVVLVVLTVVLLFYVRDRGALSWLTALGAAALSGVYTRVLFGQYARNLDDYRRGCVEADD